MGRRLNLRPYGGVFGIFAIPALRGRFFALFAVERLKFFSSRFFALFAVERLNFEFAALRGRSADARLKIFPGF